MAHLDAMAAALATLLACRSFWGLQFLQCSIIFAHAK
jgi:hypothetical protein